MRATVLARAIKQPLRAELKALLDKNQKIDAIKKYQAAMGSDLTTAAAVINIVDAEK